MEQNHLRQASVSGTDVLTASEASCYTVPLSLGTIQLLSLLSPAHK